MKFREIGNTRGKECDSFSFRVLFTEKDIKMALRVVSEDHFFKSKLAFEKNEMLDLLACYICSVCKIQLTNTYRKIVADWAFKTAERHGFIFKSSYDDVQMWIIDDTRLGIGKNVGPQKTGERVLE